jgi:Tfp pilus assembly protein PilF/glutathione synthase/RimK-type ligase-like ATP-grasp enzyme
MTSAAELDPGPSQLHPLGQTATRQLLAAIERKLQQTPDDPTLLYQQACLLDSIGQSAQAEAIYRQVLALDSDHIASLNNLGNMLLASSRRDEARALYRRAVIAQPDHLPSRANLGNLLIKQGAISAAAEQFFAALAVDPTYRPAHAGLSFALVDLGEPAAAAEHRRQAFAERCISITAYRGEHTPISVLELLSTTGGNIRSDTFLSDLAFQRILVTTEFFRPGTPLPPHQLVLNAIGEADGAQAALAGAQLVVAETDAPVINRPEAVLATGRCEIAARLANLPGVRTARTVLLSRRVLNAASAAETLREQGLAFPLLLRAPGFHGGENFLRAETAEELPAVLAQLPGDELFAIEYLDARGADGKTRKYRVMLVDGRLYPLHLAVATNWKIHYHTADMADCAANRAEDEAFLAQMPLVLGPTAMAALRQIEQTLALDYAGIDFGLSPAGEVLVFEANATMVVVVPDRDPRWDYRREPMERIYKAIWTMLRDRALGPRAADQPPA